MNNQKEFKIIEKNKDDESLDFLLENSKKNDIFKQKMNNYITNSEIDKNDINSFDKKNELPIIPSNSFLDNENIPNFESNVADTPKFYKINNNYDNLDENNLKQTSLSSLKEIDDNTNNKIPNEISNAYNTDNLFKKKDNTSLDITTNSNTVRESTVLPDNWSYKNEFPMNGGNMNGIVGFDGLESQYSDFGSFFKLETNTKEPVEQIPHDDLRKPVVYN